MAGDFDPRDADIRDREDGVHDCEERWHVLGRAHESALRGEPGYDTREQDRDGDRGSFDPRGVFLHDLELPDGRERELVHERDRDYTLNGSESRTLATVGAFRVVAERDLRDQRDEKCDLRQLEKQGLIQRVPLDQRDRAVTLTRQGRELLEHHRNASPSHRQAFYAGADRARERTHDTQVYRAYLREAAKLRERDAHILRVQLDRELKREYQRFLQERNRGDRDSDGRPDRTREEVQAWARERDLPYFDEQVHFPDARIEYQDGAGDVRHLDIEVTTEHYRGGHASAACRSGFSIHASGGGRGAPFDPGLAEEFL